MHPLSDNSDGSICSGCCERADNSAHYCNGPLCRRGGHRLEYPASDTYGVHVGLAGRVSRSVVSDVSKRQMRDNKAWASDKDDAAKCEDARTDFCYGEWLLKQVSIRTFTVV